MATFSRCLCLLLILWIVVSRPSTAVPAGSTTSSSWTAKDTLLVRAEFGRAREAGDFNAVERLCLDAAPKAIAQGNRLAAAKFMSCAGGAQFARFQYRNAFASYFEARKLAESVGDREELGAILFNLSSLYQQVWDTASALRTAEEGRSVTEKLPHFYYQPELLLQLGRLQGADRASAAESYFRHGIEAAHNQGNASTEAVGRDLLGELLRDSGDLAGAEEAYRAAYQLRRLRLPSELGFSLARLGSLKLAQAKSGGPGGVAAVHEAELFTARALSFQADARKPSFPRYMLHHQMGLIRAEQGNAGRALSEFRSAIHEAQASRQHFLPAASSFEGANVGLEKGIFDSFVEAAATEALSSGSARLAKESFLAAEINRAASLRQDIEMQEVWHKKLPSQYWELLASLRREETRLVSANRPTSPVLEGLELRISEMEAQAGLDFSQEKFENFDDFKSLKHILEGLRETEVLLSFHLGEKESFLWAVTRNSLRLYPLASRSRIRRSVEEFKDAVQSGRPEADRLGRQLYGDLFGQLREEGKKPDWLLSLEDALFELPFAALVSGKSVGPGGAGQMSQGRTYLVEAHSLQIVPGAFLLKRRLAEKHTLGRMVAVGDPIYNVADPRWQAPWQESGAFGLEPFQVRPFTNLRNGAQAGAHAQLNRLAGSGGEAEAVSRSWGEAPVTVLTGAEASLEGLLQAITPAPDIIHLATHVLTTRLAPADLAQKKSFIVLGLGSDRVPELLSESDIGVLQVPDSLVVMTGCSTASGDIFAGAGLQGLTQAWAVAGARGVVATQWPVRDLSGDFLPLFYRALSSSPTAGALRQAQVAMIHSGTAYAASSAWASYQLFGGTR